MADVQALKFPESERDLGYVGDAIVKTKEGLTSSQTMIGFAGAPFTVASYMIEGSGSKTYTEVKKLRFAETEAFEKILDHIAEVSVDYLYMQVKAGAECLMLFDTWAAQLPAMDYRTFSFKAANKVIKGIKEQAPEIPVIYYPGQGTDLYPELEGYAGDVIAVDWRARLNRAIDLLGQNNLNVSVQGNLDPQTLLAPEPFLRERVRQVLDEGKKARGHIFNVGHGLLPHLDPEALGKVVDEIRKHD